VLAQICHRSEDLKMGYPEHQTALMVSEGRRQSDMAGIGVGGESTTTIITGPTGLTPLNGAQRATRAADISHYRRCLVSALANNISPAPYTSALRELGTGGI
jgi:hypothetical protein